MAIYYADTAGSNTSPYDTWEKAATDPQTVIDLCISGGNEIRLRGSFGSSVLPVTFDNTTQGDTTNGFNKFIGYAADGSRDGTKVVFDGENTATNCIVIDDCDYWHAENIKAVDATGDNITTASNSYHWCMVNTEGSGAGGYGAGLSSLSYSLLINYLGYNNATGGLSLSGTSTVVGLVLHSNQYGFRADTFSSGVVVGFLIYNNTSYGIYNCPANSRFINGVIHNNGSPQIEQNYDVRGQVFIGTRFTGSGAGEYAVKASINMIMLAFCYFQQNGGSNFDGSAWFDVEMLGASTNVFSGIDTDYGYTDSSSGDFNLAASATMRDISITLSE